MTIVKRLIRKWQKVYTHLAWQLAVSQVTRSITRKHPHICTRACVCKPAPFFPLLTVQYGKDALIFNLACTFSKRVVWDYSFTIHTCFEFLKCASHWPNFQQTEPGSWDAGAAAWLTALPPEPSSRDAKAPQNTQILDVSLEPGSRCR